MIIECQINDKEIIKVSPKEDTVEELYNCISEHLNYYNSYKIYSDDTFIPLYRNYDKHMDIYMINKYPYTYYLKSSNTILKIYI